MTELKRPHQWATHSQLVAESLDRQRQARMLREWVNQQQNPRAGQRRRPAGRIARLVALCDVDTAVAVAGIVALFALGAIMRTWG